MCAASAAASMDFDAIIRLIHANLYIISAHLPAAANFSYHRNRIRMEYNKNSSSITQQTAAAAPDGAALAVHVYILLLL